MSAKIYKIEIIDNQIGNYFQMNLLFARGKIGGPMRTGT